MITFPPHTSHKLQPLDISVYGPLKCYYNQAVEAWLLNNKGKTFDIYSVVEALGTAFPRAFTPSNIISGFRKSGIFPFDEAIFTDDEFLSSYVTDQPLNSEVTAPVPGISEEPQPSTSSESTSFPEIPQKSHPPPQSFVTPEEVQPYPKAIRRKTSKGGRKAGRTMIATDTLKKCYQGTKN